MEETLKKLQNRRAIQRFRISEDADGSLCVDAWMMARLMWTMRFGQCAKQ